MTAKIEYEFSARAWQHNATGGWFFVALPTSMSEEIRKNLGWQEEGWGRLKARAKTGDTEWDTAIWFDTKKNTYLLPLKAAVRKKENISTAAAIKFKLWI